MASSSAPGKNVFDRLNNSKGFTGAHKERFDGDGKGKGIQGRKAEDEKRDLSEMTRPDVVKGGGAKAKGKARGAAGSGAPKRRSASIEKFGVQADKAVNVYVFRNGDRHHKGEKVVVGTNFNTWEQLLKKLTTVVKLPTGPVLKLLHVRDGPHGNQHARVTDFDRLLDGECYIACGAEKLSRDKYPSALGKPSPPKK